MRELRRRRFLLVAAAPLVSRIAFAQTRVHRIGCLFGGSPATHERPLQAFRDGLRDHGWVEGRSVALELHWAEGDMDRVPALAAHVVRSKPDVIVTAALRLVAEVKKATQSIPIVMATGADPIEWGLVTSLSRPGGNLTGLSGFYESTPVKMLELVSLMVPRGARVVALVEADTVFARAQHRDSFTSSARTLGLSAAAIEVKAESDVHRALDALDPDRPAALLILPGPMIFASGREVAQRAERLPIPVVYPFEEMAEAGGLMSYASDLSDSYRRAARYVDRILRGANPGDLAIEQPTRLALTVNLRTAEAKKIRISESIMQRADRLIR